MSDKKVKTYNAKKILKRTILVVLLSFIVITVIALLNDIEKIADAIINANHIYMLLGVASIILYFFLLPLKYVVLTKAKSYDISAKDAYLIGTNEFFFNAITPLNTGGQAFLIYKFNKYNIRPSQSSGMIMVAFLVAQLSLNIFALLGFIISYNYVMTYLRHLLPLMIIGFTINFAIFLFVFLVASMAFFRKLISKIILKLSKVKIFSRLLENKVSAFEKFALEAQIAFKKMLSNKIAIILTMVIKSAGLFFLYSVPFFVFKALGEDVAFLQIFFFAGLTSLVVLMTTWVFTPGASGGIEVAFLAVFSRVLSVSTPVAVTALLIWRTITYYIPMLLGFIFYIIDNKRTVKMINSSKENVPSKM